MQLEAEQYKIKILDPAPRGKTVKTKCTENFFVSENLDMSDENCSVDSEGGITPMGQYVYTKNILTKNKTYNGIDRVPLDLKTSRSAHKEKRIANLKFKMRDFGRMNDSWSSRNTYISKSNVSHNLNFSRSKEL